MRIWKILFFTFLILLVVLSLFFYIGMHVVVNVKGQEILSRKLSDAFDRPVTIARMRATFPLGLKIQSIEIKDLFKADEVSAAAGLFDLITGTSRFSQLKLVRPAFFIEKKPAKVSGKSAPVKPAANVNENAVIIEATHPMVAQLSKFMVPQLHIGHLRVINGEINFLDKSLGNGEILIQVKNLNAKVDNFSLSGQTLKITSFEVKGDIPWRQGIVEGKIDAEGWLNFKKKAMEASIKIKDIDGVYLYPYYSQWVDLEKARIEKANLSFTSNIHGLNNNVTAECHLELTDIVRKPMVSGESEQKESRLTDTVLDMFKNLDQGRVVLDFTIRTKMDNPQFGLTDLTNAFKDKIALARKGGKVEKALALPADLLEGAVKSASDISRAVIAGTFAVGNELKQALEASFRKEPKPQE